MAAKMTPAVTATALIKLASVAMSTLARIGHPAEEEARAARHMLDRVNERSIDFHFNWRRSFRHCRGGHHYYGGCGRSFSPFLINGDKGFVKNLRQVDVIVRLPWRDAVEIGAARRLIECALHAEFLQIFRQRDRWRFEFEFRQ